MTTVGKVSGVPRLLLGLLLLAVPLAYYGCGDDGGGELKSIVLDPNEATISVGGKQQYAVTGTFSDGHSAPITADMFEITWTSSAVQVATIDKTGLATGVGKGSTTIAAQVQTLTAIATLTVKEKTIKSIQVEPAVATVAAGLSQQFKATATYADNSTEDVTLKATWKSSDETIATVNAMGEAKGVKPGNANITAELGGIKGQAVLVVSASPIAKIDVDPGLATVAAGDEQQFTATATLADGTQQDVTRQATWTSSDNAIATVDQMGKAQGVAKGTAKITATVGDVDRKSGEATLEVTDATVTEILVEPAAAIAYAGGPDIAFKAWAVYSDKTKSDVTDKAVWSSSDESKAKVSADGKATPLAAGTVTITATFGGKTGTATLEVQGGVVIKKIEVSPPTASIPAGTEQQFKAIATFSNDTTQDITSSASWSSSDTGVATIDAGLATALKVGKTKIIASQSGVSGEAELTVTDATLASILVEPEAATVSIGGTQQYKATGIYDDQSTKDITGVVTWLSSATDIASISTAGLATGKAVGSTNITASYQGKTSNTAVLGVSAATVTSVAVVCDPTSVPKGGSSNCVATATYSDSRTENVTSAATWSTSDPNTAVVEQVTGKATGVNLGTATISASFGGKTGTATLTVTDAVILRMEVRPATATRGVGETQQFRAYAIFSAGPEQDYTTNSKVTWASSNTGVATIANNGLATARTPGSTNITATYTETGKPPIVSGPAAFTVTSAALDRIDVVPSSVELPIGIRLQFRAMGHYTDNSTVDLTTDSSLVWSSTVTTVANFQEAGKPGLATALAVGTTEIRATKGGIVGRASLVVNTAVLTNIAVTPLTMQKQRGLTQQYKATGTFTLGAPIDLTDQVDWSAINPAGDPNDVTVSIVQTGLASVGTTATLGNWTIRARKTISGGTVIGNATLTVTLPRTLSTIEIRYERARSMDNLLGMPATMYLPEGGVARARAIGHYTVGDDEDLTDSALWGKQADYGMLSVSNQTTPTNTKGFVTFIDWTDPGGLPDPNQAVVQVTATHGTVTGIGTLHLVNPNRCLESNPIQVLGKTNNPSDTDTLLRGEETQFEARVSFSSCSFPPVDPNESFDATWASLWDPNNPAVATVPEKGLVKASANPPADPNTAIWARYTRTGLGTLAGYRNVYVPTTGNACIECVTIWPANPTIPRGVRLPLAAVVRYRDGRQEVFDKDHAHATMQWVAGPEGAPYITRWKGIQTKLEGIARSYGLNNPGGGLNLGWGVLEGRLPGTATATLVVPAGTACNPAGFEVPTTVTVSGAVLNNVTVDPPGLLLPTSTAAARLRAIGHYSDNTRHDITGIVKWFPLTSGGQKAWVSDPNEGVVQATDTTGTQTIIATLEHKEGRALVDVDTCTLGTVEVMPAPGFNCYPSAADPNYPVGVNLPFRATVNLSGCSVDAHNGTADVTRVATWLVETGDVRWWGSQPGVFSTQGPGAATIKANIGTGSTYSFVVDGNHLLGGALSVQPNPFAIPNGMLQDFKAVGTFQPGGACDLVGHAANWSATTSPAGLLAVNGLGVGFAAGSGSSSSASVTATSTHVDNLCAPVSGSASGLVGGAACIKAIRVNPAAVMLPLGSSVDLDAVAVLGNGTEGSLGGATVTWEKEGWKPEDPNQWVLDINSSTGVVTPRNPGAATVRASVSPSGLCAGVTGPLVARADLEVIGATQEALVVNCVYEGSNIKQVAGVGAAIPKGLRGRCRAQRVLSNGQTMDYAPAATGFTWSSAAGTGSVVFDPACGGPECAFNAQNPGWVNIQAVEGGFNGRRIVSVLDINPPATLSVSPGSASVAVPASGPGRQFWQRYTATGSFGGTTFEVGDAPGASWKCCTTQTGDCVAYHGSVGAIAGIPKGRVGVTANIATPYPAPGSCYPRVELNGLLSYGSSGSLSLVAEPTSLTIQRVTGSGNTMIRGEDVWFRAVAGGLDLTDQVNWSSPGGITFALLDPNHVVNPGWGRGRAITATDTATFIHAALPGTPPVVSDPNFPVTYIREPGCITGVVVRQEGAGGASIPVGVGARLIAEITYSDGAKRDGSNDAGIWSMDPNDPPTYFTLPACSGGRCYTTPQTGAGGHSRKLIAQFLQPPGCTAAGHTPAQAKGELSLSASGATITGLSVVPENVSLPWGEDAQLRAIARASDGNWFDVTTQPSGPTTTWSTRDAYVAPVTAGYIGGNHLGTTTIHAAFTPAGGTQVRAFANVRVVDAVLTDIVVYGLNMQPSGNDCPVFSTTNDPPLTAPWIQTNFWLPMGHYRSRVRAIGVYTDGVARDISSRVAWLSSATGVATVVTEGAIAGVVETGDAGPNGTTLISASLNGMWGDIVLGTWTDTANNIHIYPDPQAQLALGMTRQLQVIATLNSTIRWCITELAGVDWQPDSHVTINEAAGTRGRMQGILAGTASIGASLGGLTANSSVEIVDKAVDYIKVTPATMSLQPGGVGYFHAVIVYTDGSEQDVTTAATFYEERPDVSWPTEPLPTLFTANAVLGGVMTAKSAANLVPGVTRLNACWGGAPGTGVCAWWSGAVPPNPQATDRRAVVTVSP